MADDDTLRTLEGLGYCAALMIIASIMNDSPVLRFFYLSGLTLGLIVVVRMLSFHIKSHNQQPRCDNPPRAKFEPNEEIGDEVTR